MVTLIDWLTLLYTLFLLVVASWWHIYKTVCYTKTIIFHCIVHCLSSNTRKPTKPWILHSLLQKTHKF